jgi:Putative bacterial sensory transduction regulator
MKAGVEFAHDAHRDAYYRVARYVDDIFGGTASADADEPCFTLAEGSAVATIAVRPRLAWSSVVETYSWVVTEVEPSEELCRFLLHENAELLFGAFAIKDDTNIIFKHSVVGDTLDPGELANSVRAVLTLADQYDDEITSRFGGKRAVDRIPQE